jgi:chromatin segregation and condensation protein Rec8/ScpA/Scc1 (kleisin family)
VPLEEPFVGLAPPVELRTSPGQLAAIYHDVLADLADRERPVDTSHLPPIPMTVAQASRDLVDRLIGAGGRATFADLTRTYRSRVTVAVAFLAVLDLYKDEHVEVTQSTHFGEMVIELTSTDVLAVIADGVRVAPRVLAVQGS